MEVPNKVHLHLTYQNGIHGIRQIHLYLNRQKHTQEWEKIFKNLYMQ
jgi:hypothetical protein